ncbi:hypothetical protein L1987_01816 [Smallanthus sonchifolius]|uniref:Uncharacterized protein n=1 Tax=Smallanthus sonchifolius TaxID=185202 RepID=A0ACB9K636_9ASTR|nr:hypothetical protein L1987_01816 [Smallanthus sonchifolius]
MENREEYVDVGRSRTSNLADKIKKIDVPTKGILKKPFISMNASKSLNPGIIGKDSNSLGKDKLQNLNSEKVVAAVDVDLISQNVVTPDNVVTPENVDLNLEAELNEHGDDFSIKVEYEWTPPRCPTCWVFGHILANCPKQVRDELKVNKGKEKQQVDDDGFTMVGNKKKANKKGVVIKEKPKFEYRPVFKQNNNVGIKEIKPIDRLKPSNIQPTINLGNPFSCLGSSSGSRENDESDYDEVIEVNEETSLFMKDGNTNTRASTPVETVSNV